MKVFFLLTLVFCSSLSFSQDQDDFTKRLKAIKNQNTTFYNVDGVSFSSETWNNDFSESGFKKTYKKYSIKESDVKIKDPSLALNHVTASKTEKLGDSIQEHSSYYFVENKNKTITAIWFGWYNQVDKHFERKYVNHIMNDEIPKSVFESTTIDSIDFAGRKLALGSSCYWKNINTVQCPYNGEMNWSVHLTPETAKSAIENQFLAAKSRKGGKVISEVNVPVIFEGTETTAKKIIYDFTGMKSLLATTSGGKNLTVYYIAAKVRGNYVSCVMSFWNNDTLTANGLSPLVAEVMQLKKP